MTQSVALTESLFYKVFFYFRRNFVSQICDTKFLPFEVNDTKFLPFEEFVTFRAAVNLELLSGTARYNFA